MAQFVDGILYFLGLGDNPIEIRAHSDAEGIAEDWENVGRDINKAMMNYGR